MVWSIVIVGACALAVASAQFYLPTNKAQKYVRPRMDQGKTEQKRDSVGSTSKTYESPKQTDESMSQDQRSADQKEGLRQILAAHANLRAPDGQSVDAQSGNSYLDKKRHLMCYLLLQMFDEKVDHILAEEEVEKKDTEEERQVIKQRADEAIAFINQHMATLDYCSQYYGTD